jgi:hypothetical protein
MKNTIKKIIKEELKKVLNEDPLEPDTSATEFEQQVPKDKREAFLKAFKTRLGLNQTDDNVRIMYKFSKNMPVTNTQMESIRHCVSTALRAIGVHVPNEQLAKAEVLIPIIFGWSGQYKLAVVPFNPAERPMGFVSTTY